MSVKSMREMVESSLRKDFGQRGKKRKKGKKGKKGFPFGKKKE